LEAVTQATDGLYPRLARQDRTYIYRQLTAFATGWRDTTQMVPMAKSLTQEDRRDIATYVETLGPPYPPRATVPEDVSLRGKQLATRGDPAAGVVRWSACHGNNGAGAGPNFPALAGQWSDYLEDQLHNWRSDARRNSWRGLMRPVAMGLSDADIAAVAAHYANLRLPAEQVSTD
jgi:cytochrome c553